MIVDSRPCVGKKAEWIYSSIDNSRVISLNYYCRYDGSSSPSQCSSCVLASVSSSNNISHSSHWYHWSLSRVTIDTISERRPWLLKTFLLISSSLERTGSTSHTDSYYLWYLIHSWPIILNIRERLLLYSVTHLLSVCS